MPGHSAALNSANAAFDNALAGLNPLQSPAVPGSGTGGGGGGSGGVGALLGGVAGIAGGGGLDAGSAVGDTTLGPLTFSGGSITKTQAAGISNTAVIALAVGAVVAVVLIGRR